MSDTLEVRRLAAELAEQAGGDMKTAVGAVRAVLDANADVEAIYGVV